MPIVEYYSPDTHTVYQFYARAQADVARKPRCPGGSEFRMERVFSPFAVIGRAKKSDSPETAESFSPEQETAMMRLSSQLEGLGDGDPDPRQLGRMMRELNRIMGKGESSARMDEVIRKLESGADLDRLEDQLESVMEEGGPPSSDGSSALLALKIKMSGAARKDPTLHELREWLP